MSRNLLYLINSNDRSRYAIFTKMYGRIILKFNKGGLADNENNLSGSKVHVKEFITSSMCAV